MILPENIDISDIMEFQQNHNLAFEGRVASSWELEESLQIQEVINDDYAVLEAFYNEYARAYNSFDENKSDDTVDALLLTRKAVLRNDLGEEEEALSHREVASRLLTRVIFSELVEALHNDVPDDGEGYVDFYRITQLAEEQYMPSYDISDDEEY